MEKITYMKTIKIHQMWVNIPQLHGSYGLGVGRMECLEVFFCCVFFFVLNFEHKILYCFCWNMHNILLMEEVLHHVKQICATCVNKWLWWRSVTGSKMVRIRSFHPNVHADTNKNNNMAPKNVSQKWMICLSHLPMDVLSVSCFFFQLFGN